MNIIIKNGQLILPQGIESNLALVINNGKIAQIAPFSEIIVNDDDKIIDACNRYVSPGFIDLHIHGGGGHDFMDGTIEAFLGVAETHAKHGTTAMFPTTLTSTTKELFTLIETYRKAENMNNKGAKFMGIHLEGPYFSPTKCGAQDPAYLQTPIPEDYNAILEVGGDIIARWSVAPELPGALEFGNTLRNAGILPSIAHTDAIYEEVVQAYNVGYKHFTHFYSAMSTVCRKNAYRYAGAVEAGYLIHDTTVEIIADGIHLPKPLLQFVYQFKGPEHTAICTDAMRGAGMPDGEYKLGSLEKGQTVIVEDGVAKLLDRSAFAGSVATTDRLVRTMINLANVPLCDAVKMMTSTPAKIMGIDNAKGSLQIGKDADIVIFDDSIKVFTTISEGNIIYTL